MNKQDFAEHLDAIVASQEPTSKARAAEIAKMPSFGVLEFLELTGIEPGAYGIYVIDDSGVRLGLSENDPSLSGHQRIALHAARQKLFDLVFPCSPETFFEWYLTTLGEHRVSDFPLAAGFAESLGKKPPKPAASGISPVPSQKIIEAFHVKSDSVENINWWSTRMRSAKRYAGLRDARASQGKRGKGGASYWHPLAVATWLIEKKHLSKDKVIHATEIQFPECDVDYLRNL